MTVQEKSKELVWKYYHNIEHTISNEYSDKDWEIAKQCALIAVEEILSETEEIDGMRVINNPYWIEVRNEIEKL